MLANQNAACRRAGIVAAMIMAWGAAGAVWADDSSPEETLSQMSLEQLANVEIISVSKAPESLNRAAASVYVITRDRILRSGVTSIPEALRLAPNLQVRQLSSTSYAITARGFGGNQADQNFSNKMLILIDGRSVYSPLFSGVYIDAQDVVLEDVDRIEVISGPGATLWGANAMNGVINIITRSSDQTEGVLLKGVAGNQERDLDARYGGRVNPDTTYRAYGMAYRRDSLEEPGGQSAHDPWSKLQGGFRSDWSHASDQVTLQGDAYRGGENQLRAPEQIIAGENLLGRWLHATPSSQLQLQAYYDESQRFSSPGGAGWILHTYDIQLQQALDAGSINRIVWGAGERLNSYDIASTTTLLFLPSHRALSLGNVFAQDTLALSPSLKLIGGVKLEDDPYSGWATQPDLRLSWAASDIAELWAAASRAIRSPTPFDEDVTEKLGTLTYLTGNRDFKPERVNAYEVGYRGQPASMLSVSVATFYNHYDDLRTVQIGPPPLGLPLYWGNAMQGDTYGLETWADLQLTDWWRLSPGYTLQHKRLHFKSGASGILGVAQAGDDPSSQAALTSSMDLPRALTFDASLRFVGALPDPALAGYYELNARLGGHLTPRLDLALVGQNLLHAQHLEYPNSAAEEVPRAVMAQVRWQY